MHDYVGGLEDLKARRVRFIGDPAQRIAEDYLRILRFFRFHATFGRGALDRAGLHAAIVARDGLNLLSRERVRAELMKLLIADGAMPTLAVMAETGFIELFLAGVPQLASAARMIEAEAAAEVAPDPVRRLAALAVLVAEDAERLTQRLRLFNVERERLESMADRWWHVTPALGEAGARALLYRLGAANYLDRVLLACDARTVRGTTMRSWRELVSLPARWPVPRFPLRSADLTDRGVPRGPALGAALRAAEDAWIAAGFPLDASALDGIADAAARGA